MPIKFRPNTFSYYRLFFAVLMFSLGIICLGIFALESFGWLSAVSPEMRNQRNAVLSAFAVTGGLSLYFGSMMTLILTDRRVIENDRRQHQVDIDFPDRRSGVDRREVAAAAADADRTPAPHPTA